MAKASDKEPEAKGKGGRPSSYKPEYAAQAEKLCKLGATDIEIADFFGVERTTVWRWSQAHEEFCNALKAGKEVADERVERSLYARALGYTHDAVKIFNANGEALVVPYREHVAPDTTACIFWLKNRKPGEWRDKQDIEHSGGITVGTKEQRDAAVRAAEAKP
jgi:hypothetical protein